MNRIRQEVESGYPCWEALYRHLHAHPELSAGEKETAARLARELTQAGCQVTTGIGGHGIAGILKNGAGPTILLRADMDALPLSEQTGLPYASTVRTRDSAGNEVGVMHACGHDLHMTILAGAAQVLGRLPDCWHGTLFCIGQPSEEKMNGAQAMVADGILTRFPYPDLGLSLHIAPDLAAGTVGVCPGYAWANADMLTITVHGVGGHGAYPHRTRDPIVLAAQLVLALQAVVGREINPVEPALVSVGAIHGGTAWNVIPQEVRLMLTVRTFAPAVRRQLLDAIDRTARGLAIAAGIPEDRFPIVEHADSFTQSVYNDPVLTARITKAFRAILGPDRVVDIKPEMGGEDFGLFGVQTPPIPISIFRVGVAGPGPCPPLHSPHLAPCVEPALKAGIQALCAAVVELGS